MTTYQCQRCDRICGAEGERLPWAVALATVKANLKDNLPVTLIVCRECKTTTHKPAWRSGVDAAVPTERD
jgi:hypothetical protein